MAAGGSPPSGRRASQTEPGRCPKASWTRAKRPPRRPFARGSRRRASTDVYTWDGERVFKIVSFFLAHARRGRIGALAPGMEIEVAEVRWLPLADGPQLLAYKGEREMAVKAVETIASDLL